MIKLQVDNNGTWVDVDLFDDIPVIPFNYEAFDAQSLDKVKNPLDIKITIPMTSANMVLFNNYTPQSSLVANLPSSEYSFKLLNNSDVLMRGNLYISQIVYNTLSPYYDVILEDKIISFLKKIKTDSLADYYTDLNVQRGFSDINIDDFFSNREYGGNTTSDNFKDVAFPYIDMCGDEIWKGYPFRAYTQYGFSWDRTNFVPSFKVKSFIERLFNQNNLTVKSKAFGINETASGVFNVDRPYFFTKGKLLCDDTYPANRFEYTLTPYREFVTVAKPFIENYFDSSSDENNSLNLDNRRLFKKTNKGYNYSPSGSVVLNEYDTHREYKFPTSLALEEGEVTGHVAPNATYTARTQQKTITIDNTASDHIDLTIPAIYNSVTGRVNVVYDFDLDNSDMTFRLNRVIYEDGYPKYEFPVTDSSGEVKIFTAASLTKVESSYSLESDVRTGVYGDSFFVNVENGRGDDFEWVDDNGDALTVKNNALRIPNQDVVLSQETIEIFAGSEYSISYRFEPIEGEIVLKTYNELTRLGGFGLSDPKEITVGVNGFTYLFAHYNGQYTNQKFGITVEPSGEGRSPVRYNDDVNVWFSIEKSVDITPFDALKAVLGRFNFSMIYDYQNDTFVLDTLKSIRGTNTDSINTNIDDAKEINIFVSRDKPQYLNIENTDYGLFYDKNGDSVFGDLYKKEINSRGEGDVSLKLGSALYNNLGGDEVVETISDEARWKYNNSEQGYTRQEFTAIQDIGIRFGYMTRPKYKTAIYAPYSYSRGYTFESAAAGNGITAIEQDRGGSHRRFGTYYLTGRLVTNTGDSANLDLSDPAGYVDNFITDDRVYSMYKNKISFNAVFDSDYLSDPYSNMSRSTFSLFNNNYIHISRLSGEIYGDKMYSTVEAIIL